MAQNIICIALFYSDIIHSIRNLLALAQLFKKNIHGFSWDKASKLLEFTVT